MDCLQIARDSTEVWWNTARHQQFDFDKSYSSEKKQELRKRNLCIGTMLDMHLNCDWYKCLQTNQVAYKFSPLHINRDLTGDEICGFIDSVDCLNDSEAQLTTFLNKAGNYVADMFLFSMDDVVSEIKSGKNDVTKIDLNKGVCFSVDSNGDTIWHVLVRESQNSFATWANMCLSLLDENEKTFMYEAAFFQKNNYGKSAVGEAISLQRLDMFSIFGDYFKQEKQNSQSLVAEIATNEGVGKKTLSPICHN